MKLLLRPLEQILAAARCKHVALGAGRAEIYLDSRNTELMRLFADAAAWCSQPVAGDWRDKIKAARKEEKRAAKKAAKAKSSDVVDLDALSATLPANWRAMRAPEGDIYYGNIATKVLQLLHLTSCNTFIGMY